MSWMDSWSRPSKGQATPAPYYLLPGGEATPYCHSCGRVICSRRNQAEQASKTPIKYCSSRCRSRKPGKLDREIEAAFMRLLNRPEHGEAGGKDASTKSQAKQKRKGDQRRLVVCSAVEELIFGHAQQDSEDVHGTQGSNVGNEDDESRALSKPAHANLGLERGLQSQLLESIITHVDGDVLARMSIRSGTRKRPSQSVSEVNGSVGGEKGRAERIEETAEMREKREKGQRRAKEREMVRCAARRGVVFGFISSKMGREAERKKCEAVMLGKVVEPSFAKGDWSIRWRE